MRLPILIVLLSVFSVFIGNHCYSQRGILLNAVQMRPTGEFGSFMGPSVGFGIRYMQDFDERLRYSFGFNFVNLKPRMENFPIVGVTRDGSNTIVSLGNQHFDKYNVSTLEIVIDYAIIERDRFCLYSGLGMAIGGATIRSETDVPLLYSESYDGGYSTLGLIGRLGAEYSLNDRWSLMLDADRRYFLMIQVGGYSSTQVSFGLKYKF
jgi:opacity protein-like surface antigen